MNTVGLLFVACLVAVASASPRNIVSEMLPNGDIICKVKLQGVALADCPPTNCPPLVKPPASRVCGAINCADRNVRGFLFPTADPNFFLQCAPSDASGNWVAMVRPCGCMTYFDYTAQRCLHPYEWTSNCNSTPNPPPAPIACKVYCPTCDDVPVVTQSQAVTVTTLVPSTPIITTSRPNTCQCPCMPCIWWPCVPCPSNCPCTNNA
ncbi:unnamed protein product [Diamesa serratosioi]